MVLTRRDEAGLPSHATRDRPRRHYSRPGSPAFTSSGPRTSSPLVPRREPNFSYRLLRAVYPFFRVVFPNQVIRADDLAGAMVDVVVRGAGKSRNLVLENRDIRAMVSLPIVSR